jgi:hypothetical protein
MSRGVMPYAVSLEQLRELLEVPSEQARAATMRGNDAAELEVLRTMVSGGAPVLPASEYAHMLERLCHKLGRILPNNSLSPGSWQLLESIARTTPAPFVAQGLDTKKLFFGGPPVHLPPVQDYPVMGHLDLPELRRVATLLESVDLTSPEPEADDALADIADWVVMAVAANQGIVCFYY